jgi:membrane fusion protein (multidrug efflux system)
MPGFLRRARRWLLIGLVVVVAAGGFVLWRHLSPRESTDDAQVSGHVSPVAARVGGSVKSVHVRDNQAVRAGDVLVEIDPHDYQIAVQRAEADLAAAEASARAARNGVPITTTTTASERTVARATVGSAESAQQATDREIDAAQAKLAAARARVAQTTANATRATGDLERLKPLAAKDEIPRQQLDAAVTAEQAARAETDSARASMKEAEANVAVAESRRAQAASALAQAQAHAKTADTAPQQVAMTEARAQGADAQVMQAKAALEQARLNLDRTNVRAPAAGVVSRKSVEVGQMVQPGQPLLALTSLDEVWVIANFKETQLRQMQPGQRAAVSVDAYGGRGYEGRVESVAAATGATFSLLPPDNASGNFVKVVQRIPVKIVLDGGQVHGSPLRPGMSAEVTVYLK